MGTAFPDRASIERLIARQAFPLYQGYPSVRAHPEILVRFLSSWLDERSRLDTCLGWVPPRGRHGALTFLEKESSLSTIFGFPMARVSLWGGSDEGSARSGLAVMLGTAHAKRIRHISCRVDARETGWRRALVSEGFYAADTLVACVTGRSPRKPKPVRWGVRTRPAEKRDERAVVDIARSSFVWDRFHSDPHLPARKCGTVYADWARRCCRNELADHVRVGIRGGRVAGFVAHRLFRDLERLAGLRMYGHGLGAARPGCGDVYMAAVSEEICNVWDRMDWIEIETQAQNLSHLRLLSKMGFSPLRTSMTYHRWFGP